MDSFLISSEQNIRQWNKDNFETESYHQDIANHAYEGKNGNKLPTDGWNFRGRGMIHVTGRDNYKAVNKKALELWPDDKADYMENPSLLEQPKYAARSALAYWVLNKCYVPARKGTKQQNSYAVTAIVNKHTNSYKKRAKAAKDMKDSGLFSNICYNVNKIYLRNVKAKIPFGT